MFEETGKIRLTLKDNLAKDALIRTTTVERIINGFNLGK